MKTFRPPTSTARRRLLLSVAALFFCNCVQVETAAQETFFPAQFKTFEGAGVYHGNLALWSYQQKFGYGYASLPVTGLRMIIKTTARNTSAVATPILELRDGGLNATLLYSAPIAGLAFAEYRTDTITVTQSLFFIFRCRPEDAGRGDLNIYIQKVVIETVGINPPPPPPGGGIDTVKVMADSAVATWEKNLEPDLAGYAVSWGTASRNYSQRASVTKLSPRFVFRGLEKNRVYYTAVTAIDSAGNESDFSSEIAFMLQTKQNTVNSCDLTQDGKVDNQDWFLMRRLQGVTKNNPDYRAQCDLNQDGKIDGTDKAVYVRRCRQ